VQLQQYWQGIHRLCEGEGYTGEEKMLKRDGQSEAQYKRIRLIERCVYRNTKPLHMQDGNTCVGRLLASSCPTTLSFCPYDAVLEREAEGILTNLTAVHNR
jgi:hypothetical protein